jgi:sporulation protein YlmC with PRC-barrel domain
VDNLGFGPQEGLEAKGETMAQTPGGTPFVLSASSMESDKVVNPKGEDLGSIEELMVDVNSGRIAYAVLSFGGILGIGNKLFAIPWDALKLDTVNERFILDVDKQMLEDAPGFDKDNWPKTTEHENDTWMMEVYNYYDSEPYWRTGSGRRR